MNSKFILDACCGGRMFWFNKKHPNTLYIDLRPEVFPDAVQDFRNLPYKDESFKLIVFDPPHLKWLGKNSIFRKKYGALNKETWEEDIKKGASELWRILEENGILIFKWGDHDIPYKELLKLFPVAPLFGQRTASNQRSKGGKPYRTYWFCFMKISGEKNA